MIIHALSIASLVAGFVAPLQSASECSPECQMEQVEAYHRALDAVFREGSTEADVDALFSILHDQVRYVHAAYEADFETDAWRAAFVGNLHRGAYRNGPERQIGILRAIHGMDAVAVEYAHGEVLPDGNWKSGEPLLVLFRFTEGRIALIEELW